MVDDPTPVVTAFLRNECAVLLLKRSDAVGSYRGLWGAVAGHLRTREGRERAPVDAALAEIREETGLADHVTHVRTGEPFAVHEGGDWLVHPLLFDCDSRAVTPNEETATWAWVAPTELLRRETVPQLWTSYDRVRPTVETVATDTDHGSATLSLRALECLRDSAALKAERGTGEWTPLADLARDLLAARPLMAVVTNRVNRVLASADRNARAVETAATTVIEAALAADDRAAAWDEVPAPETLLTLSRSGTARRAIENAAPERVYVAESRPAREGVAVAETLAETCEVTLHTDAAAGYVLATDPVEAVLVGADAVLADGSVVNKTGTRLLALAATREEVPVYVVCAADKVTPREEPLLEFGPDADLYDGPVDLSVSNPTFDVTPVDLLTGILTDRGVLDVDGVREVAAEHAALADWDQKG
jgi:translation initiation factor 2B subunit (eIF-2B alpha/beta/delta family)